MNQPSTLPNQTPDQNKNQAPGNADNKPQTDQQKKDEAARAASQGNNTKS